jgi:uncharacterized membrane protein
VWRILGRMTGWGIVGGLVMALAGALVLVVAKLGRDGRLRRNHYIGIRVPSTLSSDEAWRLAHRVAAPSLEAAGRSGVVGGVAGIVVAILDDPALFAIVLGLTALGLLAGLAWSTVAAVRAARTVQSRPVPR